MKELAAASNSAQRATVISRIGLPLLLLLATFAVYAQIIGFAFISSDDDRCILHNPAVQTRLTLDSARSALTTRYEAAWQPVTWRSFMLDFELFGLEVRISLIVNGCFARS